MQLQVAGLRTTVKIYCECARGSTLIQAKFPSGDEKEQNFKLPDKDFRNPMENNSESDVR